MHNRFTSLQVIECYNGTFDETVVADVGRDQGAAATIDQSGADVSGGTREDGSSHYCEGHEYGDLGRYYTEYRRIFSVVLRKYVNRFGEWNDPGLDPWCVFEATLNKALLSYDPSSGTKFTTWLYTLLANAVFDAYKDGRRHMYGRTFMSERQLESKYSIGEEWFQWYPVSERVRDVTQWLLPEDQYLCSAISDGRSISEIAKLSNWPRSSVDYKWDKLSGRLRPMLWVAENISNLRLYNIALTLWVQTMRPDKWSSTRMYLYWPEWQLWYTSRIVGEKSGFDPGMTELRILGFKVR